MSENGPAHGANESRSQPGNLGNFGCIESKALKVYGLASGKLENLIIGSC
jgi:hypothetical protein